MVSQGLLDLKFGSLVLLGILPATSYPFKYPICLTDLNGIFFFFSKNLEWFCHVRIEKLIRYVKGDLKLAIGSTSLVSRGEIRTGAERCWDRDGVQSHRLRALRRGLLVQKGPHPGAPRTELRQKHRSRGSGGWIVRRESYHGNQGELFQEQGKGQACQI